MTTLISLVGTNPLPCYVLACYLNGQDPLDRIYLVGTPGVQKYVENLQTALQQVLPRDTITPVYLADLEPATIRSLIGRLATGDETVYLDYTGGRKTMSAHAVAVAERARLVYMDAGKHRLVAFNSPRKFEDDLRAALEVKFETLFDLHGYSLRENRHLGRYREISRVLFDYAGAEVGGAAGRTFGEFGRWVAEEFTYVEPKPALNLRHRPWPENFSELAERLVAEFEPLARRPAWETLSPEERQELAALLAGDWLVMATFEVVRELAVEPKITDCARSLVVSNIRGRLDIALLQGYQLTLIRCLTRGYGVDFENPRHDIAAREVALAEGFKTLEQARHLGGGEARAVLVTLLEGAMVEEIEQEIRGNGAGGKVSITGQADLVRLGSRLREILSDRPPAGKADD